MTYSENELGLIVTTLDRLRTQRLPRALSIKEKVDAGGTLDQYDIAFLEEIFHEASFTRATVETHPEFQDIVARPLFFFASFAPLRFQMPNLG
ncbi:hypothetical protein CCR95_21430 [Thiocystis minor]|uniref:hypothetical protein n=1 Tax=Thiocystis minor TaxID=61597 RepID=UPI001912DD90|nr:hypothetical protein [Thiocystis minor]MBK5966564.1 hypothetical protein [Thiocystis minor]